MSFEVVVITCTDFPLMPWHVYAYFTLVMGCMLILLYGTLLLVRNPQNQTKYDYEKQNLTIMVKSWWTMWLLRLLDWCWISPVYSVSPQLVEWQLFEDISSYKCRFKENKFRQLYEERIFTNLLTISKITLSLTFIRRKLVFYHRYMAIWLSYFF